MQRLNMMVVSVGTFLDNPSASIESQAEEFRVRFFHSFLMDGKDELPILIYARIMVKGKDDTEQDSIVFAPLYDKAAVRPVIESVLIDGATWVMQVNEAYRTEADETGAPIPATRQECLLFATHTSTWSQVAMHGFKRRGADLPDPVGGWEVHDTTEAGSELGGALLPFQETEQGN